MHDFVARLSPWWIIVVYLLLTVCLIAIIFISGNCWEYCNAHPGSSMSRRDFCLNVWVGTLGLLTLSQIGAFLAAICLKSKFGVKILLLSGSAIILFTLGYMANLFAHMPS